MYSFEDGYRDSYSSRVINEAPEAPVSVVTASLRTRYRANSMVRLQRDVLH
ncbi:hypothetical protein BDY19DRAFT_1060441 [Irpex rosettiformis]|uniref:Uncharacterized protein n=1 Tax=Irpex rosettiformis TaxID=378272 RepID=A0ACB8TQD8_9APHY|nr:hypothetical protein BDY19DRAFT_1060441 [Irpex rosettiformis]